MKYVIYSLPALALCAATAAAQTSTATGTEMGEERFGTSWPLSIGSTFFNGEGETTLRTSDELSGGWQSLSQEDRDMVKADCQTFMTLHGGAMGGATGDATTGAATDATTGAAVDSAGDANADATTDTMGEATGDATTGAATDATTGASADTTGDASADATTGTMAEATGYDMAQMQAICDAVEGL